MKTILETDNDFIYDVKAQCFQELLPEESEVVRVSKTQVLFRKDDYPSTFLSSKWMTEKLSV